MSRFLVVEDEAIVAMLIEDMLTDLGHQAVLTAHRLDVAAEAAATIDVDAAVLDVNLAGELSFPVADILERRGIPFAFSTGYGRIGLDGRFSDIPVVAKPFTDQQFALVVDGLAQRAKAKD